MREGELTLAHGFRGLIPSWRENNAEWIHARWQEQKAGVCGHHGQSGQSWHEPGPGISMGPLQVPTSSSQAPLPKGATAFKTTPLYAENEG